MTTEKDTLRLALENAFFSGWCSGTQGHLCNPGRRPPIWKRLVAPAGETRHATYEEAFRAGHERGKQARTLAANEGAEAYAVEEINR